MLRAMEEETFCEIFGLEFHAAYLCECIRRDEAAEVAEKAEAKEIREGRGRKMRKENAVAWEVAGCEHHGSKGRSAVYYTAQGRERGRQGKPGCPVSLTGKVIVYMLVMAFVIFTSLETHDRRRQSL